MKLYQVAIAFDQLIGTVVMNCDADETMSAKLWRCQHEKRVYMLARKTVDFIARLFGDREHCYQSYLSEKTRKQLPQHYAI